MCDALIKCGGICHNSARYLVLTTPVTYVCGIHVKSKKIRTAKLDFFAPSSFEIEELERPIKPQSTKPKISPNSQKLNDTKPAQASGSSNPPSRKVGECIVCCEEKECHTSSRCDHIFCGDCLQRHYKILLAEGKPSYDCCACGKETGSVCVCEDINPQFKKKYDEEIRRREVREMMACSGCEVCPFCSLYACFPEGVKNIKCEVCGM